MRPACLLVLLTACGAGDPAPTRAARADDAAIVRAPAGDGPVVLELFTSQGCSSCPPADRWLASVAAGDLVAGRRVIPLAFHVDYWNDLGWADPFSTAAWSDRQAWYAARLPGGRVYTPALVVGGVAHAVGSRRAAIERAVAAAPPTADLEASLVRDGALLRVTAATPPGAELLAAVVERARDTHVEAGENAGEVLRDRHIVRALVPFDDEAVIAVEPAWGRLGVVVFAQEPGGEIVAARALD